MSTVSFVPASSPSLLLLQHPSSQSNFYFMMMQHTSRSSFSLHRYDLVEFLLVLPHDRRDTSTSVAQNHSSGDRQHHNTEPPSLALLTKTSHCSKFKNFLEESVQMKSDSLASLELFIDGIKSALDMALCSHYSFAPYNEWALEYLVTTKLYPQPCVAIQDTQ
jgi:hypothetical protein